MTAEQHGALATKALDQLPDLHDLVGIQATGRLVEEKHFRIADHVRAMLSSYTRRMPSSSRTSAGVTKSGSSESR